jgi:hypothetical protein
MGRAPEPKHATLLVTEMRYDIIFQEVHEVKEQFNIIFAGSLASRQFFQPVDV